jgi:hypothetical protein
MQPALLSGAPMIQAGAKPGNFTIQDKAHKTARPAMKSANSGEYLQQSADRATNTIRQQTIGSKMPQTVVTTA